MNVGIAVIDDLFTYKSVVYELPDGRGNRLMVMEHNVMN